MGAFDCVGRIGSATDSKCWTMNRPEKVLLQAKPYFVALVQPWIDDSFRLYFPDQKAFPKGYSANAAGLFVKQEKFAKPDIFPVVGKPFVCQADEKGETFSSVISMYLMRGSFQCSYLVDLNKNQRHWNDFIAPLYEEKQGDELFIKASEIVCGSVQETVRSVPMNNVLYFLARKSNSLLGSRMLKDENDPVIVVGNKGALMHISPSARSILEGQQRVGTRDAQLACCA